MSIHSSRMRIWWSSWVRRGGNLLVMDPEENDKTGNGMFSPASSQDRIDYLFPLERLHQNL